MQLRDLVAAATGEKLAAASGPLDIEIAAITAEAPAVKPGTLFAAIPGAWHSGPERVPEALERGAVALLLPEGCSLDVPDGVGVLQSANPRRAVAFLSAALAGPSPKTVVAVTGTCGKT